MGEARVTEPIHATAVRHNRRAEVAAAAAGAARGSRSWLAGGKHLPGVLGRRAREWIARTGDYMGMLATVAERARGSRMPLEKGRGGRRTRGVSESGDHDHSEGGTRPYIAAGRAIAVHLEKGRVGSSPQGPGGIKPRSSRTDTPAALASCRAWATAGGS